MIPFENGSTARAEDYAEGTIVELDVPWNSEPEQYEVDGDTFAVIFTPEGEPVDLAHNMDTSRSMVNEGYLALVVKPTEQFSIEELQRSLDLEAVAYADCFDKSWKNHQVL